MRQGALEALRQQPFDNEGRPDAYQQYQDDLLKTPAGHMLRQFRAKEGRNHRTPYD